MERKDILKINKKLLKTFEKVNFEEEGHRYWITGQENKPIKSVSTLLKLCYDEFDTEKEAEKWSKSRGLPLDYVLAAWEGEGDIATSHGSKVHLIGEQYGLWKFLGIGERPMVIDKKSLGAIQFLDDLPDYLVPVAFELKMYSPHYWYTGTADIILYNTQTNNFIIADFKTNKTINDDFPQQPMKFIDKKYRLIQDNEGKYSLQFCFYQILLEDMGFKVGGRVMVWLTDDKENKKLYKTIRTPNVTRDLRQLLDMGLHLD